MPRQGVLSRKGRPTGGLAFRTPSTYVSLLPDARPDFA